MADLVELRGTYTLADMAPETGTIRLRPQIAAVDATPAPHVVTESPIEAVLDEAGAFSVMLTASDDPGWALQPGEMMPYRVTEALSGSRASYTILVTGPGPVDITEVRPGVVDGIVVNPYPLPGGATDHGQLTGRDAPDSHPVAAVTGLQSALDGKVSRAGDTMPGPLSWLGPNLGTGTVEAVDDPGNPGSDALEVRSGDGVLLRGPYIVLDSQNPVLTMQGGIVGSPVQLAGFDSLGGALLGWGAPLQQPMDASPASPAVFAISIA